MLSRPFAVAITGYQRYISPYKGFCCAHRVKHGGVSCSEYVKQTLLHHGVWRAIPDVRQRFKECKAAALALSAASNAHCRMRGTERNRSRRKGKNNVLDYCDCCNPIDLIPSEGCSPFGVVGGGIDACSCTPW